MLKWIISFYDDEGTDVAWLVFPSKDALAAFALGRTVVDRRLFRKVFKLNGFEVYRIGPNPISPKELAEFLAAYKADPAKPEEKGGGT